MYMSMKVGNVCVWQMQSYIDITARKHQPKSDTVRRAHTRARAHTHTHTHTHMYVCMNVCMHACTFACMYVCMSVCTLTHPHAHTCTGGQKGSELYSNRTHSIVREHSL